MSRHHRKPGKRKDQESSSRLYRVPTDGDDSIKGKILIDIRPERKVLASLIEMALRKLTVATKTKMPDQIAPMLPTVATEPFDDPDWQFELERNGYRTLAYLQSGHVKLRSTATSSYHQKLFTIRDALSEWNINAVVDGVVVMVSSEAPPSESFQQWEKNEQDRLFYHAFDLLWLEDWNLMNEPLYIRREILKQLIPESGVIRFSDHIDGVGKEFFQMVKEHQLGGVIAKNKHSVYTPGVRSGAWRVMRADDR